MKTQCTFDHGGRGARCCVMVEQPGDVHEGPHFFKCSGPSCPGYIWPASVMAHPYECNLTPAEKAATAHKPEPTSTEAVTAVEGTNLRVMVDGECAICSRPTDSQSGLASVWPVWFPHPDGKGEMRCHHVKCVTWHLFGGEAPWLRKVMDATGLAGVTWPTAIEHVRALAALPVLIRFALLGKEEDIGPSAILDARRVIRDVEDALQRLDGHEAHDPILTRIKNAAESMDALQFQLTEAQNAYNLLVADITRALAGEPALPGERGLATTVRERLEAIEAARKDPTT